MNKTLLLNRVLVYFVDNQEFKGKMCDQSTIQHHITFPYRVMNKTLLLNYVLVYFVDNQEFKLKNGIRA